MSLTRNCLLALALAATPAAAQDGRGDGAAFDDALKEFGYAGGAAWQCAADAGKGEIVESAMHIYNRLAQLFGTDRAFFFSAAFGAGSVDEIGTADCDRYAAEFAEGLRQGKTEDAQ
ncbi:MAG: hypothetical protein AAFV96_09765 [Pseudomonadota bacterium]